MDPADAPETPKSLVGWLARKGSSLGDHLNSIESALTLGAIHPRSGLAELNEEQAETVRRLALASLLAFRQFEEDTR